MWIGQHTVNLLRYTTKGKDINLKSKQKKTDKNPDRNNKETHLDNLPP